MKTYDYTIGAQYVCALEYGDLTGLDDNEIHALEDFMSDLPASNGHWSWGDDESFARDDVMGYWGQCVKAEYVVMNDARIAELEAISPFKLTTDQLYEALELSGFKPADGVPA